jgi:hypothetical protein
LSLPAAFHDEFLNGVETMAKHQKELATTAAADDATAAADNAAAAVRAAVAGYDPNEDPRVWRVIAGVWRAAAHELVEVAEGLAGDGKVADIIPRLKRMLAERVRQEPGELESAVEEFRKSAERLFIDGQQNEFCGSVLRQIRENERMKAEARLKAEAADRERRELQALQLEREAERLRQGPPRPASFIEIPAA